ncbi:hypothetical protein EVAR_9120_1 [Eumeta japonica]|uniref:Uncharacterized protein n=1 Tax=Eumeta variegata TaxID=151549 RepID=A0A4C1TW93_EUMVA|nr:hypothetical protein EVAR_9120_1 [Eumeta japonica]
MMNNGSQKERYARVRRRARDGAHVKDENDKQAESEEGNSFLILSYFLRSPAGPRGRVSAMSVSFGGRPIPPPPSHNLPSSVTNPFRQSTSSSIKHPIPTREATYWLLLLFCECP